MNIDQHISEITRLRVDADKLPDDNPGALMEKIELLARCLVYIGRLSSFLDGEYKRVYAKRKYEQAVAEVHAKPPKKANSEIAIAPIRLEEAKAYEMMHRWRNAFESTQEEVHALKMRMRIDFAEGGSNVYVSPGPEAAARAPQEDRQAARRHTR